MGNPSWHIFIEYCFIGYLADKEMHFCCAEKHVAHSCSVSNVVLDSVLRLSPVLAAHDRRAMFCKVVLDLLVRSIDSGVENSDFYGLVSGSPPSIQDRMNLFFQYLKPAGSGGGSAHSKLTNHDYTAPYLTYVSDGVERVTASNNVVVLVMLSTKRVDQNESSVTNRGGDKGEAQVVKKKDQTYFAV